MTLFAWGNHHWTLQSTSNQTADWDLNFKFFYPLINFQLKGEPIVERTEIFCKYEGRRKNTAMIDFSKRWMQWQFPEKLRTSQHDLCMKMMILSDPIPTQQDIDRTHKN